MNNKLKKHKQINIQKHLNIINFQIYIFKHKFKIHIIKSTLFKKNQISKNYKFTKRF